MAFTRSYGPRDLDEQIRERLVAGKLPGNPHARYSTAAGDGQLCVCCDRAIADFSLQYDVEWPGDAMVRLIGMHRACFQCWRDIATELGSETSDGAEV